MTLVDDCIKERWQTKKVHHIPVPLIHKTVSFENINPRAIMQSIFGRRHSHSNDRPPSAPSSPLRFANPVPVY